MSAQLLFNIFFFLQRMMCDDGQDLTQAHGPELMTLSAASEPPNHTSAPMQIMSSPMLRARQQRRAVMVVVVGV